MGYIRDYLKNRKLKEESRTDQKHFTRERKVGFTTLICMILNMVKRTTQIEIDEFLEKFEARKGKQMTYTGTRGREFCPIMQISTSQGESVN